MLAFACLDSDGKRVGEYAFSLPVGEVVKEAEIG